MSGKVLVAGLGNIFHGDDGFGVEVAKRLRERRLPEHVDVVDFGIRGFDFACTLLDQKYDEVLMVDTVSRGEEPGTISLIDPDLGWLAEEAPVAQGHLMDPAAILGWVSRAGGRIDGVRLLGCEPADLGSDEELKAGLSAPVAEAADRAVEIVVELCTKSRSQAT